MLNLPVGLPEEVFTLNDLGDEMNEAFLRFYQAFNESPLKAGSAVPLNPGASYWGPPVAGSYDLLKSNFSFDMTLLVPVNQSFFDKYYQSAEDIDSYFHNFSGLWRFFMIRGQFDQAESVWEKALNAAQEGTKPSTCSNS
jgi:hypothetical protein